MEKHCPDSRLRYFYLKKRRCIKLQYAWSRMIFFKFWKFFFSFANSKFVRFWLNSQLNLGYSKWFFFPIWDHLQVCNSLQFFLTNWHSYKMYSFGEVLKKAAESFADCRQISICPELTQSSKGSLSVFCFMQVHEVKVTWTVVVVFVFVINCFFLTTFALFPLPEHWTGKATYLCVSTAMYRNCIDEMELWSWLKTRGVLTTEARKNLPCGTESWWSEKKMFNGT